MPANYRDWQNIARDQLKALWLDFDLPLILEARFDAVFHGPGRADPDNLLGSVFDAGLPEKAKRTGTGWRGCWRDDRVTVFPRGSWEWSRSPAPRIDICLTELHYEV